MRTCYTYMGPRAPPTLPDEVIVEEILTRLPVKLVVRFRSVCKLWNSLLSRPSFILPILYRSISGNRDHDDYLLLHTYKRGSFVKASPGISILSRSKRYEIRMKNVPRDIEFVVGSKNGLVCMVSSSIPGYSYYFLLWNPVTNLSKQISLPNRLRNKNRFMFGFGFDSVANNYKIIVQDMDSVQAVIYSSETDSWINIVHSKISKHIFRYCRCWIPSVIVKGDCYWDCFGSPSSQVLKFEARNNELTYLRFSCVRKRYQLVNLNDCLARIEYESVGEGIIDVYTFNEDRSIWSKIYTSNTGINDVTSIKSCFKSGELVVKHGDPDSEYSFCDPKSKKIRRLARCYRRRYWYRYGNPFNYTPSLIALEGIKSLHP